MIFFNFSISARDCCHFLVIERCGDVHKLVVVRICTRRLSCFHSWVSVFLNLGIRHFCLSNLTTAVGTKMSTAVRELVLAIGEGLCLFAFCPFGT